MAVLPVDHVTDVVRTRVLPSLYVPVATMGSVVPRASEGLAGVTASETRTGCPTLSVAGAVIVPVLLLSLVSLVLSCGTVAPVIRWTGGDLVGATFGRGRAQTDCSKRH